MLSVAMTSVSSRRRLDFRLAVPKEHGSWSLALEPIVLGFLAAPSWGGVALACVVLAGFFSRRPLKVAFSGGPSDRATEAKELLLVLAAAGLLALATTVFLGGWRPLWPLAIAIPFAAIFLVYDFRNEAREGVAELAGATAFAVVPAALALLGGRAPSIALALSGLMLIRSVPTVLMVRSYLRQRKGQPAAVGLAIVASLAGFGASVALYAHGLAPWVAPAIAGFLAVRAFVYLCTQVAAVSARTLGLQECAWGVLFVVAVGLTS